MAARATILDFRSEWFFYLHVTLILHIKFRVHWPFCSGEQVQNRFSRWLLWQPYCIFEKNNFRFFYLQVTQSFESIGLLVQEKKRKIGVQDGGHGGHVGLWIRMILVNFDLRVTLMLSTKFRVNWPFSPGEEAKNRFSRWRPWRLSLETDRNDFCHFWSITHFNASYPVSINIGLLVQEKKAKIDFQHGGHGDHLGFWIGIILAVFDLQVIPMLPTKFQVNGSRRRSENRFSRWQSWWPSCTSDQNDF